MDFSNYVNELQTFVVKFYIKSQNNLLYVLTLSKVATVYKKCRHVPHMLYEATMMNVMIIDIYI